MRISIILIFSFLSVLFAQTQLSSDIDGEAASDKSGWSVYSDSEDAVFEIEKLYSSDFNIMFLNLIRIPNP